MITVKRSDWPRGGSCLSCMTQTMNVVFLSPDQQGGTVVAICDTCLLELKEQIVSHIANHVCGTLGGL